MRTIGCILIAMGLGMLSMATARDAMAGETYVRDGDTIVVNGTPVRLKGLSCDELNTNQGISQKYILQTWMNSASKVNCTLTGEKTYDREVGWCSLDGQDIGEFMIETTGCQPCRRYDTTGKYSHLPVDGPVPNYCRK